MYSKSTLATTTEIILSSSHVYIHTYIHTLIHKFWCSIFFHSLFALFHFLNLFLVLGQCKVLTALVSIWSRNFKVLAVRM